MAPFELEARALAVQLCSWCRRPDRPGGRGDLPGLVTWSSQKNPESRSGGNLPLDPPSPPEKRGGLIGIECPPMKTDPP